MKKERDRRNLRERSSPHLQRREKIGEICWLVHKTRPNLSYSPTLKSYNYLIALTNHVSIVKYLNFFHLLYFFPDENFIVFISFFLDCYPHLFFQFRIFTFFFFFFQSREQIPLSSSLFHPILIWKKSISSDSVSDLFSLHSIEEKIGSV